MVSQSKSLVLIGVGFALGLLVAVLWSSVPFVEKVSAKPNAKPAETARYRISSFGDGGDTKYGAYVVDVYTGEVFMTKSGDKLTSLGRPDQK